MRGGYIVTVGLSGSSSAGKTTLTAMLSRILPKDKLILIHADDFNKEFEDLPKLYGQESHVLDADSKDSVYFDRLVDAIDLVQSSGRLPDDYDVHDSVQADLQKSSAKFSESFTDRMKLLLVDSKIQWGNIRSVLLVDGFLLFHNPNLRSKFDIMLLLRITKETARLRRFGRYGEATVPEGSVEFWKTQSYFEDAVWPNYAKEHAFLFPGGDVEANIDHEALREQWGICTPPEPNLQFEETVTWGVSAIAKELQQIAL